jgi:4-aminobutyrate aminotransferase-like enzyme
MPALLKGDTALDRRRRVLGPTYSLFYEEPLHAVRAEGVWIHDSEGRAYLDAYNNVPVVGHCHPRVVEAIARQASRLNTHTRFLIDEPTALAERLLATMPREIGNMVFTCSGSEANDLAVRICKAATGGTGFIVTACAYHGTTETTAGMSPAGRAPRGPGVYHVAAPLGTEGPARFAAGVRACIERMRAEGVKPAALLVDTVFSSDGLVAHPPGFLAERRARDARGRRSLHRRRGAGRFRPPGRGAVGIRAPWRRARRRDDGQAHGQTVIPWRPWPRGRS